MLKICDAIMGGGKTSAAISFINAHPEKRFLYITPYLPEAARIKEACPEARFVEPSKKMPQNRSKAAHTLELIREGRNVASTHAAMMYYTEDTLREMRDKNYTIIADEQITVLQQDSEFTDGDVQIALDAGYLEQISDCEYRLTSKEFSNGKLQHMFRLMQSRDLIMFPGVRKGKRTAHYWIYPSKLFEYIDEVYLLTYQYKGSMMDSYVRMNNIEHTYIGVRKTPDGRYEFSDEPAPPQEYVRHLPDKIHIEQYDKINAIGDKWTALSMNWYDVHKEDVEKLRKNIQNYFLNRTPGKAADRLCARYGNAQLSYGEERSRWAPIRGKGYWNSDLVFSQKSTNQYSSKFVLAYPVNIFANKHILNFFENNGAPIDENMYALSIMVQWIWRSAIRNGEDVWIYVPSRRMRELLTNWVKEVSDLSVM